MKYSDYKVMVEKEYEKNQKNIYTCYLFLVISAVFFVLFFFQVREFTVIGAAFLLDAAAAVYALRAFKSLHPYWEMQLALKAGSEPSEMNVNRFTAGVEYAVEKGFPPFKGRSLEIFEETAEKVKKSGQVSKNDLTRMEQVLSLIGVSLIGVRHS